MVQDEVWVKPMVNCFQTNLPIREFEIWTLFQTNYHYMERFLLSQEAPHFTKPESRLFFITPADDSQGSWWMIVHNIAQSTQTCVTVAAVAAKYSGIQQLPYKLHWTWSIKKQW